MILVLISLSLSLSLFIFLIQSSSLFPSPLFYSPSFFAPPFFSRFLPLYLYLYLFRSLFSINDRLLSIYLSLFRTVFPSLLSSLSSLQVSYLSCVAILSSPSTILLPTSSLPISNCIFAPLIFPFSLISLSSRPSLFHQRSFFLFQTVFFKLYSRSHLSSLFLPRSLSTRPSFLSTILLAQLSHALHLRRSFSPFVSPTLNGSRRRVSPRFIFIYRAAPIPFLRGRHTRKAPRDK